jgi:putative ribosome biogenesis GTPase RsgA
MKKFKFKAKLLQHNNMDATYVIFPYDVKENFGAARVKVKVKFDGEQYRGSLVPMGLKEGYPLLLRKDIRSKINKKVGDFVNVELEQDLEERIIAVPDDFEKALKQSKLKDAFDMMSFTHRKEYVHSVIDAKKPETRTKRIEKAMVMIEEWMINKAKKK